MEQRLGEYRMDGVDRALSYTVLTDVLRQWLVIFCFAVSAALLAAAVMQWHYQPSYTSQATLYVTKKGLPNNVYDNESSAQVMAEHFEQILNSSILQKKVAEEIHLADFAGSASAEAVEGTNLINLAVTAASPELCFKLMQSILKNYSLVSDYMTGNAILEILKAPKVPLTPDQPFERRNIMIKAFLAAAACWVLIFGGLSWLKDTIRTEEDIEQLPLYGIPAKTDTARPEKDGGAKGTDTACDQCAGKRGQIDRGGKSGTGTFDAKREGFSVKCRFPEAECVLACR